MTYQSHSSIINAWNPTSFSFALETTHSDKAHFINTKIALQYASTDLLRKTSTFRKYTVHKVCPQNTFMHFPHPRSLLVRRVSARWEGQLLAWRPARVCRWLQREWEVVVKFGEAFGVWVMLGLTPAPVCLIMPPWKNRALLHTVPQSCTSCPRLSSQSHSPSHPEHF